MVDFDFSIVIALTLQISLMLFLIGKFFFFLNMVTLILVFESKIHSYTILYIAIYIAHNHKKSNQIFNSASICFFFHCLGCLFYYKSLYVPT